MNTLPRLKDPLRPSCTGWLNSVANPSYNSVTLSSAITRGYSDVVGNLLKSGVDWRELDRETLAQLYGMISDSELRASVAAWAVANELEGLAGPNN